jgi:hypothetical protein
MVEMFHQDLGRHIAGVAKGGGYGKREPLIGGWLHTGRIDATGICIKDMWDLDAPVTWQGTASATRRKATG